MAVRTGLQCSRQLGAYNHLHGHPEQAARERGQLEEIAAYMQQTGTKLLMYSGLRFKDARQFAEDLDMLNRGAEECARP